MEQTVYIKKRERVRKRIEKKPTSMAQITKAIKQKDLKQNLIQQKTKNKAENNDKKKKKSVYRPNSAIKYQNNKKKKRRKIVKSNVPSSNDEEEYDSMTEGQDWN